MGKSRFIVREGHFHITDKSCYVVTGWFEDGAIDFTDIQRGKMFTARLGEKLLCVQVQLFSDSLVRQKYAKYDKNIETEYVIVIKLPQKLDGQRWLTLALSDGKVIFRRREAQLRKLQTQLNFRITNTQVTGASCVLNGWAVSQKPIKVNVFDQAGEPVKCEVSHFPKPDVALEYREAAGLSDSGFSVTVPVSGRAKYTLQVTDGERSASIGFRAKDKQKVMFYIKKAHYFLRRNGIKNACKRAVNELYEAVGDTGNYTKWRKNNLPSKAQLARQRQDRQLDRQFYILTPYEDAKLMHTALSIKNQTYADWKWVVICTGSEQDKIKDKLSSVIPKGRLLFATADESAGIALENRLAIGIKKAQEQKPPLEKSWMFALGASDTLEPDALYVCAAAVQRNKAARMCYTDEDKVCEDGVTYKEPVMKPDFNLDMLRAMNYLGHMVLFRMDLVKELSKELSGQDRKLCADAVYDYYLRGAELCMRSGADVFQSIVHVPRVAYHAKEGRAADQPKTQEILNEHFKRQGIPATAVPSRTPGIYRTVYHWNETPMVSINIPNKDHIEDLDTCVQSVLKYCKYPNFEIVIIENNSVLEETFSYYKKIQAQDSRVRVLYWKDAYNFAKITNFGAERSKGEYLLLLNNDTEVISPDFMEEMLGYCMRDDVGVCGARLLYFDDTVQHAGVVIGLGGICGESFQRFPKESGGYLNRIFCPQDISAVTGACLMTKKSIFMEVGGMDGELQIAYNDIDYCLKVRKAGKLVVYNPFAVLHHYEYKSRGVEDTAQKLARYHHEVDIFTTRWAQMISDGDPYYNPNLTRRYQDFSLRRVELWK